MLKSLPVIVLLTVVMTTATTAQAFGDETVTYLQHVKPILQQRCYACHGALKQESELRLDTTELLLKGGSSGPSVIAGKPDAGELTHRIMSSDPTIRMPPEGSPLSDDEISQIRQWILQGAQGPVHETPESDPREHWAFQKPMKSELPSQSTASGRTNPIDAFIEAELEAAGLQPRPRADKATLLRRVSLDLIGLPPTREELQSFLADESPDAYESAVDRLLNDQRHGERWGRHWMDVWRYSDWYGRRDVNDVRNSASQMYRWRDWIIRSLNQGRGYDRMVREMLAADEISPEDYDAGVATGYLIRNYYSLNANDWMRSSVEHTGKAFLGLTFNCAHCHDHKYDPITHDDYFRMRAFFEPMFIRQDRVPGEADPGIFQDYTYSGTRAVQRLGAVRVYDRSADAPTWFYTGGDERNRVTERGSILPGVPAFLENAAIRIEPFVLPPMAWYPGLRPEIQDTIRSTAAAALHQAEQARDAAHASHVAAPESVEQQLLEVEREYEAALQTAGSNEHPAIQALTAKLQAARRAARLPSLQLEAADAGVVWAQAELMSLDARIAADRAKYAEMPAENLQPLIRRASHLEREATLRKAEADVVTAEFAVATAEARPSDDAARAQAIETAMNRLTSANAVRETALSAMTDEQLSETWSPLTPQYPQQSTGRRRALAEWITDRENPLTARVAVNHIWARHFHSPLVAGMYDFGRNGASPTHPELLDWLAVEFMDSGWDMKHLHRMIVTSETYRRDSRTSSNDRPQSQGGEHTKFRTEDFADGVSRDPENRLLWRMNTSRMEAEVVRDSLLYTSGRLDLRMGGVELENADALTTTRRSLYYSVFPESGGRSAFGELFDAPDPLDCYRRVSSIVPQQALALTNSELVSRSSSEIVRAWQSSEQKESGDHEEAFIIAMFEQILSRAPTEAEKRICLNSMEQQKLLATSEGSAEAGTKARESLVRILFNHNDFLTIR